MASIHQNKKYMSLSGGLKSRFYDWVNRSISVKTGAEIADLRELSFRAYKLAKYLEEMSTPPKQDNLELFDCINNKHDVKIWHLIGNNISDRKPVYKGECTKCVAEIVSHLNNG